MYVFMLEGGTNHLYIRNNIFKAAGGINANGSDRADYLYVYNNVWANDSSSLTYGVAILLGNVLHTSIKNNIFYNQSFDTVTILGNTTNIEIDYNLAYNSNGTQAPCVLFNKTCQTPSSNDLWNVNPQFVDPASGDYHLKATSLAIDAGYNLGNLITTDFDGVTRPQGAGFDIGPYELTTP
jgi:hypothetical protein